MEQSYDELRKNFRWERPEKFNFATDVIDRWAQGDPEKLAMLWVDDDGNERRITFSELSELSCQRSTGYLSSVICP